MKDKLLVTLALIIGIGGMILIGDMPIAAPYEPTDNPAQRVGEFIRGERQAIEEADLHSPNVPAYLRNAALEMLN
jgi:hypothetical protein